MKSTITITPMSNIENTRTLIDHKAVTTETWDSFMDVFELRNVRTDKRRRTNLMDISLYDDVIVRAGIEYKVLGMMTK
jgi:hypothetical protein